MTEPDEQTSDQQEPTRLLFLRNQDEFELMLEDASSRLKRFISDETAGDVPGDADVEGLLRCVEGLMERTGKGTEETTWQEREARCEGLLNIYRYDAAFNRVDGWDTNSVLGRILYLCRHYYTHRSPHVFVASLEELTLAVPMTKELARKRINEKKSGLAREGTPNELRAIINRMDEIQEHLESGDHPPRSVRQCGGMGRMYNDGWDPMDFLGRLGAAIESYWFLSEEL